MKESKYRQISLILGPTGHLEKTSWNFQDRFEYISDYYPESPKNPVAGFSKMTD